MVGRHDFMEEAEALGVLQLVELPTQRGQCAHLVA